MKLGISWEYAHTWALYYLKDHPLFSTYYNSWYIDFDQSYYENEDVGKVVSGATPNNGDYVKLL